MLKRRPPKGNLRRTRSIGGSIPGVTTSKNLESVQHESFQERVNKYLLDRDPRVRRYESQSEYFTWIDDDGTLDGYHPDFKVFNWDGTIDIYEITRTERYLDPKVARRMLRREKEAKRLCAEHGWGYIVLTERDLPSGAELANLEQLAGFRAMIYNRPLVVSAIVQKLSIGRLHLGELAEHVAAELGIQAATVRATIFHLIWHRTLDAELSKLLLVRCQPTPTAFVWLPSSLED